MSRRELPKPALASWPIWRNVIGALYLWAVFTFFAWSFDSTLNLYSTGFFIHPLTVSEILLGSGWVPIFILLHWAWRPRRKHGKWFRWFGDLIGAIYGLGLILLLPISSWNILLKHPWNWITNGVLVTLFLAAWILPALSFPAAKKLARAQLTLNLRVLGYGGLGGLMVLAGILGASFGLNASRNGEAGSAILVLAFLFSLVAIPGTQYAAERLWPYRPWQKEEEE